ncbi:MAG: methenyltetrahydromethanopterin cyclohydrolase [Hyphomicrobiaceae bacterium]
MTETEKVSEQSAFSGVKVSVNKRAAQLVEQLVDDADALQINISRGEAGERLIDLGAKAVGGLEAGRRLGEICMGGLGKVSIEPTSGLENWPWAVNVSSCNPVISCLASQYGGWTLQDKASGFFAVGSGPARALSRKEKLFGELGYVDAFPSATLVIEGGSPPPTAVVESVADDCLIKPENLTILYAPTGSLAGGAQIVARVLEVALHKAHELGFALSDIVDGNGSAPLSPPTPDFISAMGRTNDAIIYAGRVQLFVRGSDANAEKLAADLPSSASSAFGQPFADVFKSVDGDFYKIDPMLFSPAKVAVTNLNSGATFFGGKISPELIDKSFGS